MAERRSVIEYAFQGNTLDLQSAIKQVNSLMNSSVKQLKAYQQGVLTDQQAAQVKSTKKLIATMKASAKIESILNDTQKRVTLNAGREALRNAQKLSYQLSRVQIKAQEQAAAEQERITQFASVSGQEAAKQQAFYLEENANRLKQVLSPAAYDEIKGAVADYGAALKDTSLSQTDLANITQNLNQTYANYSKTLQNATRAQQSATKGIISFGTFMEQARRQIELTVKSMSFWIQILQKAYQLFKQGVTDASAYIESVNFLNVTIGESNEKFREFIKLQQMAFGLDPTQLNETAATFYSFGNAIGFAKDQIDITAESLTKLAADLASLRNTDLAEMTTALRSALAGNTKPLMRFGIAVHDASVEEWLLTKGIDRSMKIMSEASQAAARYAFIIDKTTSAQGDLARTLKTPANQLKILNTQMKLLFQNGGAIILTVLGPAVRLLNMILQPINALLMAMTALSSKAISGSIGNQSDALEDLSDTSEDAAAGLTSLDEINQASGGNKGPLAGVDKDVANLIKGYDNMAKSAAPLVGLFEKIGKALAPIFEFWNKMNAFSLIVDILETILPTLDALLVPLGFIFDGVSWFFNTILTPIIDVIYTITSNIWLLIAALTSAFMLFMAIKGISFLTVLKGIAGGFMAVGRAVVGAIVSLAEWIASSVVAVAKGIALTIKNWALAGSYWKIAVAAIAAAGAAAIIVAGIVLTATAGAESQANGSMSEDYTIPAMAKGGMVKTPTLSLIGEGMHNEAVIPLGNSPQFISMKEDIATQVVQLTNKDKERGRGNNSQPVVLNINGRELARAIIPDISNARPQTGVKIK